MAGKKEGLRKLEQKSRTNKLGSRYLCQDRCSRTKTAQCQEIKLMVIFMILCKRSSQYNNKFLRIDEFFTLFPKKLCKSSDTLGCLWPLVVPLFILLSPFTSAFFVSDEIPTPAFLSSPSETSLTNRFFPFFSFARPSWKSLPSPRWGVSKARITLRQR